MVPTASPHCKIKRGYAARAVLHRCALSYVEAIDVVVWQCEGNLSDSERCQTLHVGMLYGLFRIDLYALSYVGANDVAGGVFL